MIVSCGEALIEFMPAETIGKKAGYVPRPAGSPFNVATGLARLETPAGFLGGISTDFFGDRIMAALAADGVDTSLCVRLDAPSTLAFVDVASEGEPNYAFFTADAADRQIRPDHVPAELPEAVRALHVGSFALAVEPTGSTLAGLIRREHGQRIITLSPNVRPALVGSRGDHVRRLEALLEVIDLVKVSRADLEWLYPGEALRTMAMQWLSLGPSLVVVTDGGDGALAFRHHAVVPMPTEPVSVVDTVGAGDSFMAALLAELDRRGFLRPGLLDEMPDSELRQCLKFANRVAGLTCSRPGADPPRRAEVVD
jgi:fructokinase